nr:IS66 family transposase [Fusicatenibacter saccharivorans]
MEVRSEALSAETPIQYPIAENKRIEAYKAKWCASSSLARQEREFARYDLDLSTKTMANWIINCADRYLKPLYQLMKEELLESRYIHCDESRIQVLGEPDQKGTTQNWMWVYLTDEFSGSPQMVLFDYERTRAGYHPVNFLGDRFHGYLTCDGYQAYHSLGEGIIVSGCLTHARRRFDAALTALKKDFTKEQLKETIAYQAMSRIGILYKIEEMIHNKTPEEKYEERQKQSRPVMDALFEWLHTMEDSVDRSSLIGDAILYTLNQEAYLKRYLEDGHLSIDNNSAERALKNFAVGRRNWLFAKSVRGAGASALVYSITETALLNHLKPYAYLTYILDELRKMGAFPKEKELKKLLPWSEDLPEYCRTKLKK